MEAKTVTSLRGFRGARLGPPYQFSWTDLEPTNQTWNEAARGRGCTWMLGGMVLTSILVYSIWGSSGLIIGYLFCALPSVSFYWLGFRRGRSDDEPVPKRVLREAWIEHADGEFFFCLAVNGRPEIWQPWAKVGQFNRTDFWSMFGDGGASPYKTSWHAIVMQPEVGSAWLIGSTMEEMNTLIDRFTQLDLRFSASAREAFMSEVALQERKQRLAERLQSPDLPAQTGSNSKGVPYQL